MPECNLIWSLHSSQLQLRHFYSSLDSLLTCYLKDDTASTATPESLVEMRFYFPPAAEEKDKKDEKGEKGEKGDKKDITSVCTVTMRNSQSNRFLFKTC